MTTRAASKLSLTRTTIRVLKTTVVRIALVTPAALAACGEWTPNCGSITSVGSC